MAVEVRAVSGLDDFHEVEGRGVYRVPGDGRGIDGKGAEDPEVDDGSGAGVYASQGRRGRNHGVGL